MVEYDAKPKRVNLEDLWVGDISEAKPLDKKITVVISYCQGDLGWLDGFLAGHDIDQHLLISKCGNPIPTGNWRKKAEIIEAQNVGGNDQSVAAVLANVTSGQESSDVYFFLKDNIAIHRKKSKPSSRSFNEMLHLAALKGFSCFQKPARGFSQFHDTMALKSFKLKKYRSKEEAFDNSQFESVYANMSEWLHAMNLSLSTRFTPVCYGGSFAVKSSQVFKFPIDTWLAINTSLSRGNNIEEGHFAERAWAGIFSLPLSKKSEDAISNRSHYVNFRGGEIGALVANTK